MKMLFEAIIKSIIPVLIAAIISLTLQYFGGSVVIENMYTYMENSSQGTLRFDISNLSNNTAREVIIVINSNAIGIETSTSKSIKVEKYGNYYSYVLENIAKNEKVVIAMKFDDLSKIVILNAYVDNEITKIHNVSTLQKKWKDLLMYVSIQSIVYSLFFVIATYLSLKSEHKQEERRKKEYDNVNEQLTKANERLEKTYNEISEVKKMQIKYRLFLQKKIADYAKENDWFKQLITKMIVSKKEEYSKKKNELELLIQSELKTYSISIDDKIFTEQYDLLNNLIK